jgi:hypothetical protein
MALYGHENLLTEDFSNEVNMDELVEMYFIDDISRMSTKQIKEFVESEQAKALVEKAVLTKPTMMRLSKQDDETRRIKLACYQLAKEANDPNFAKMVKYRDLWKKYRALIFQKYANKATRIARISQKEYLKKAMRGGDAEDKK